MNEAERVAPAEYKDRRDGLIVFGILLIILGCVCACGIPLSLVGLLMSEHMPSGSKLSLRMLLPGLAFYLVAAVTFIWLGIGSIKCRRWARALLLVLGWFWLLVGVSALAIISFTMSGLLTHPGQDMPQISAASRGIMLAIMLGMGSVLYVFIPGALVLFYRSPHVKATCEARDPKIRWTDACPLPVLGVSLLLAFSSVSMLTTCLSYQIIPFFGMYLTGFSAVAVLLLLAAAYGFSSWNFYKVRMIGWWTAIACYSASMISSSITFMLIGYSKMYELMELSPTQLQQIKQMGLFEHKVWLLMLSTLPVIGFIIYTKKYFKKSDH